MPSSPLSRRAFLGRATALGLACALPGCVPNPAGSRVRFGIITDVHQDVVADGPERLAAFLAAMRAAELMVHEAARAYEAGANAGEEANMAKMLAADASWEAGNVCVQTYGGFGFAAEYDIERKLRETRLYQVAPISTNLILAYLAEHALGLPRSY